MGTDSFEILLSPAFILIFLVVAGIGSLIPAIATKFVMNVVFGHLTNFALILLMMMATGFATVLAMGYLGLLNEARFENLPPEPAIMLTIGAYALQLALLTAFVPDEKLETIAMWKWAIALVLQYVLIAVIVFIFSLILVLVAATAQATPLQGMV